MNRKGDERKGPIRGEGKKDMMRHEIVKQIAAEIGYQLRETHIVGVTRLNDDNCGPIEVLYVEDANGHSVTFETNSLLEAVSNGVLIDELLGQIISIVISDVPHNTEIMSDLIRDFNSVKSNLKAVLINFDANNEFLKNKPHFDLLDLSVVYRIEFLCDDDRVASIYVTDELLDEWHIEANVLHETAIQNTKRKSPVSIKPMYSVLKEILGATDMMNEFEVPVCDILVISNEEARLGSIHMVDKNVLYEASKLLMTNKLYILPSSVHEVLVCRSDSIDRNYAANMVKDVNAQFVDMKDVLSNNIYLFDADTNQITIV